jgi:GTP-binding protein Era
MDEFRSGFLTIVGCPNVGKSTFINNLIGDKVSIVTPKPQTTRDNIRAIYNDEKMQLVFIDTPGIHKGKTVLGRRMSKKVVEAMDGIDIVLLLADITKKMEKEDRFVIKWLSSILKNQEGEIKLPVFLLLNKIDLLDDRSLILPIIDIYKELFKFTEIIPVSALKKDNFQEFLNASYNHLSEGPHYYPPEMTTDQEDDFYISEIIREKLFLFTHQEIPYSTAVRVTEITPRDNDETIFISAIIYVEKEGQKPIIIGKQGSMLKNIGASARKDLEKHMGKKIYLELSVKVKDSWSSKENILKNWGY